jgi:PAS domain S-box-containing protein
MDLALVLFLGGLVIIAWIFFWARSQEEQAASPNRSWLPENLPMLESGEAVIVAHQHGKLLYINTPARQMFQVKGGVPSLTLIAEKVNPPNTFLELFAQDGHASFQIDGQWIQASSYSVPVTSDEIRTVVVFRPLTNTNGDDSLLDMSRAISIINEIGDTLNATIGLEPVLQTILTIVGKHIPFDAAEITLWDESSRIMVQRGWSGDTSYLIALAGTGGFYEVGEGITGWIAENRQPILIDGIEPSGVQSKLETGLKSFVGTPISLGDQFIGSMELASNQTSAFTAGDMALLQAISKSVAVTIYNADVYTQQATRINDIATFQRSVYTSRTTQQGVQHIYATLNERIATLLDSDMCGILLYDSQRKGLAMQVPVHGLPEALVRNIFIPLPANAPQTEIWENQQYWMSNDVPDEPLVQSLGLEPIVSLAGIANTIWMLLELGGSRIGVIAVSNKRTASGFSTADIQNLTILSAQAAVVIENMRLFEREQQMDAELVGLQEMTNAIGTLSHEAEFYSDITERIGKLMNMQTAGILLYNEATEQLIPQLPIYGGDNDLAKDYVVSVAPGSVMRQFWQEEIYWYSNHAQSDTLFYAAELDEIYAKMKIEKTMFGVMQAGGRRLGVVQVANKLDGEDFTDSDARLLLIFATQAGAIIENSRLYREAQRSAEQAQGLRRIAELAGNVLTSQESITPVLAEIANLTRCDLVYVNVLEGASLVTYPRYTHNFNLTEPIFQDIYAPNFEHSVALSQRSFITENAKEDPLVLPSYKQIAHRIGINNSLIVPLSFGERQLGEIGIANTLDGRSFTHADIEVMQVIASQIAAALDRLLLYEATGENLSRRIEELDAVSRVSNELTSTLDLDQILHVIAEESIRATGAGGCTIALIPEGSASEQMPLVEKRLGLDNADMLSDAELEAIRANGAPVNITDYEFSTLEPAPDHARSALVVPIYHYENIIGVIHLYHESPNHFDERAAAFMLTMAVKASLGYGNAVRYREQIERSENLRRRVDQLNRIFELGHMVQTNADPEIILEAIAYSVQQSVGFDTIVMLLLDESTRTLQRVASAGLPLDQFQASKADVLPLTVAEQLFNPDYRISESFFYPIEKIKDWYVEGVESLSAKYDGNRTLDMSGKDHWHDGDLFVVRLTGPSGALIGLMALDRPHDNMRPDRGTVEVLEIFANQAASTIENARLYLSTVANAEQEAKLNDIMEALSRSLKVEDVVRAAAEGTRKLIRYIRMTIVLTNESNQFDFHHIIPSETDETLNIISETRPRLPHGVLRKALDERTDTLYIGDDQAEQYDDLREWREGGEHGTLILPMLIAGDVLGVIHIGADAESAHILREERQLLRRLNHAVIGSVQNALLFDQAVKLQITMESRANQLAALTEVSSRITSSLERDEVINLAVEEMAWLLPYTSLSIWRRHGSFMVLEQASVETGFIGSRFLLSDYEPTRQVVDSQRIVVTDGRITLPNIAPHANFQSWMGIPLVNQGHVVGMMMLADAKPNVYDGRSDQNIAFAFAAQVAIALANADLFEQTFDRTNELGMLLEAAQATALTTDLDSVFKTVVDLMFNALEMDKCAIMIWNEVDNSLEVQLDISQEDTFTTNHPLIGSGTVYDLAHYPARLRALRDREVVVISRDDDSLAFQHEIASLRQSGEYARMLVPLVINEVSRGLIVLGTQSNEIISQQKVRLARALGSQVAVAIENARLSAETTAHFEESLLINDLSRAISSTLDLEDMFSVVREQLPSVTGASEMYLALYDQQTESITFPLAVNRGETYGIQPRKLNNDEVSFIIKHRRPLNLGAEYYSTDELRESLGIVNGEGEAKSYLGVPLIAGDEVYGVLAVRDTQRTRAFTINEQRILTTVGAQLGAAIQNARLFRQVTSFADDLENEVAERTRELEEERDRIDKLYQITSELARTLDMDHLMPRALGMVSKAVNAKDGVIMQLDPITDQLYSRAVLNPNSLYDSPTSERQLHPAERVARSLIMEDETVRMINYLPDEDYWDESIPTWNVWKSALAILLETNEELLGVMVLLSDERDAFQEAHVRLVVAAGNQVASSINNAELYKMIREQAERLGTLLRAEQEEADKNKAILEGIADGVVLADTDGKILLFNNAAERIFQMPRNQALGQQLSQITGVYGATAASWAQRLEQKLRNPDEIEHDFLDERITLADRTVSVHLSPVYTEDKFLGTVSVFRDITSEVLAERSKSEFVANVSHEFRTPLTSIKGYNDLILMGAFGEVGEQQKMMLTTIKENITRLAALVEDVLNISKIDSGREHLTVQMLDINKVVEQVLDHLLQRPQHQNKHFTVNFDVVSDLPLIQGDVEKLTQVINNLIDNAFNYTPSGGTIGIELVPQDEEERLLISVSDTGVGIPENFRESVWERFKRDDETAVTLEVAGTGLGLSIVKELVEMHNGQVWFESEVNVGTTFYITLPYYQPQYYYSGGNKN